MVSSESHLNEEQPFVVIVDDDATVREALQELMLSAGMQPVCFASPRELLDADILNRPGCLILDVRMPGASGLDLQHQLAANGNSKPIIFLTGHGDIPMSVQAMKSGAVDFLTKPVRDQTLLDAVVSAIERDMAQRAKAGVIKCYVERLEALTPREREILAEVTQGRLNKQIAYDLKISGATVKLHRSNVMKKMGVATIGELIRVWESLPSKLRADRDVRGKKLGSITYRAQDTGSVPR
jgi:FixJ family two-component response regulator